MKAVFLAILFFGLVTRSYATVVINRGGTYSGTYVNYSDVGQPAVLVNTTEPVTFEGAHIYTIGNGIQSSLAGNNIRVQNCHLRYVGDGANYLTSDLFKVLAPASVSIVHNWFEGLTTDIWIQEPGPTNTTAPLYISANRALDPFHFAVIFDVQNDPNVAIYSNEITASAKYITSDKIDIYDSSGTPAHPLLVAWNYIEGSPRQTPYIIGTYLGGSVPFPTAAGITTDGVKSGYATTTANILIKGNTVIDQYWAGIQLFWGHHATATGNVVIASGISGVFAYGIGIMDGNLNPAWVDTDSIYGNYSICQENGQRTDYLLGVFNFRNVATDSYKIDSLSWADPYNNIHLSDASPAAKYRAWFNWFSEQIPTGP